MNFTEASTQKTLPTCAVTTAHVGREMGCCFGWGKQATYMHPDMALVVCVWLGKTKIHIAQITSHVFSQNSHFTNLSISILAIQTVWSPLKLQRMPQIHCTNYQRPSCSTLLTSDSARGHEATNFAPGMASKSLRQKKALERLHPQNHALNHAFSSKFSLENLAFFKRSRSRLGCGSAGITHLPGGRVLKPCRSSCCSM